jgi:hypothetical protein
MTACLLDVGQRDSGYSSRQSNTSAVRQEAFSISDANSMFFMDV